jgi:hypothetical protein
MFESVGIYPVIGTERFADYRGVLVICHDHPTDFGIGTYDVDNDFTLADVVVDAAVHWQEAHQR